MFKLSKVRTSGIIQESIVDGIGLRYVVFFQGCPHNCRGMRHFLRYCEGSHCTARLAYAGSSALYRRHFPMPAPIVRSPGNCGAC